jgi:predicted DNA-binding transcriptional regulator AlpA
VTKTRPTAELEVRPNTNPASMNVSQQQSHLRLLGYSIQEFCTAVGISLSFFYELKQAGLAPRAMKLGTRRIISVEEAQKWCRERTQASAKVVREARPR